jgi:hypothetical protein
MRKTTDRRGERKKPNTTTAKNILKSMKLVKEGKLAVTRKEGKDQIFKIFGKKPNTRRRK